MPSRRPTAPPNFLTESFPLTELLQPVREILAEP
jgi:hypothetical protein